MTDWKAGDHCRVVEHDDATRRPKVNGLVMRATVERAGGVYVQARAEDGSLETYYRESGWRSGDGRHQWRLLPGTGEEADTAADSKEADHG